MTGPITGTLVPTSARWIVASKSPLTMGWGESHAGGFWGVEVKRAGYDGIVVSGKAKNPTLLVLRDGEVEFLDATPLWGRDTRETEEILKERVLRDSKFRIACIGPAGENMVRYACIVSDVNPDGPRVAGRTGMGAVMGSKNLKAIAVRGSGRIEVSDFQRLKSVVRRMLPLIMSYPTTQILASYGTAGEAEIFYEYGDMPIKYFTLGRWSGIDKIKGEALAKTIVKGHRACFNCPIGCWRYVENGEIKGRGPEYETVASFGSLLMIDDPVFLARINDLCNRLGVDTITTGSTIAWAIECYEKGVITSRDTGGLKLEWGNPSLVLELVKLIGEKRGFGRVLSEGSKRAAEIIGRGSEDLAIHVKGLEVPMHDPRAFKGMGLQYATSNRGACHLQGLVLRVEQGERMHDLKIYERVDRFEVRGKGRIVAVMQDWHEILESMVLCKFLAIPPAHVTGLYNMVTGLKKSLQDLLKAGERIFNLKRLYNIACGYSKRDDTLPKRLLEEPLKEGGAKGQIVELEPMLIEYYEHRGWDENGIPTREKLEELKIREVGEKLLKNAIQS